MTKVKTKVNGTNTAEQNATSTSKIDAIKELIFGDNIVAYNSEFEVIKKDILAKKQDLESLIEDVRSELIKSIDDVSTDVNIRITELEDKLNDKADKLEESKLDRKQLGELLVNLGEKISQ